MKSLTILQVLILVNNYRTILCCDCGCDQGASSSFDSGSISDYLRPLPELPDISPNPPQPPSFVMAAPTYQPQEPRQNYMYPQASYSPVYPQTMPVSYMTQQYQKPCYMERQPKYSKRLAQLVKKMRKPCYSPSNVFRQKLARSKMASCPYARQGYGGQGYQQASCTCGYH